MRRSTFLTATIAALGLPQAALAADPVSELQALERRHGGRLGVYAVDTGSGRRIAYRERERFPMCSTFKVLAVGALLQRVQRGQENIARTVSFTSKDLLEYAPVTRAHVGAGGTGSMSLGALCAAAIELSDNTAANLILREVGGPAAVTSFARSIGDAQTRLDRREPELNSAMPGDPRDTTTPASMAHDVQSLVFGSMLGMQSARLRDWMLACKTADGKIPAGLPKGWRSGNKTGTGGHASANDVAFILPPGRAPVIVAAYYTASAATRPQQDAVLASVGRIVAASASH